MTEASIALTWPVRWKRIANGEKIIEQTGPDEFEVDVREGEMSGGSWIEALSRLFAEAEREMRKSRRGNADSRTKVQVPTTSKARGQNHREANKGGRSVKKNWCEGAVFENPPL